MKLFLVKPNLMYYKEYNEMMKDRMTVILRLLLGF